MSPRILLLDCSEGSCGAALGGGADAPRELVCEGRRHHSQALLPMVQQLLDDCGLAAGDLQAIAHSSGPGSWTGLRVGLSVAQGLALAGGAQLLPIPSLHALALQVPEHRQPTPGQRILAALDARMESVYSALFEVREGGLVQRLGDDALCPASRWRAPPGGLDYAIGSGVPLLDGMAATDCLPPPVVRPASLWPLACRIWAAGGACAPADSGIAYLQGADAWRLPA